MEVSDYLRKFLRPELGETSSAHRELIGKLETGRYLRAYDPQEHFCIMFLPFEPSTGQMLVVHHKKAGMWLFPGGHIEPGESTIEALNREVQEELGFSSTFPETTSPFMFSVTRAIDNIDRECKTHFDLWFELPAEASRTRTDSEEFFESRWVDFDDAMALIRDRACRSALTRLHSQRSSPAG